MPDVGGGGVPPHSPGLLDVLAEARAAGFFGPGPLEIHLRHADGFASLARRLVGSGRPGTTPRLLDLGSGGGLPGLVVAERWPEASLVLLDASTRRTAFLRRAVERLGFGARVEVVCQRAEEGGREPALRGHLDAVLARSFGPPAVVAECAAPFLVPGGWVVVSEPPAPDPAGGVTEEGADGSRWPAGGLAVFGLAPVERVRLGFTYQILRQVAPCPDRFPRRNGVPAKKPLF